MVAGIIIFINHGVSDLAVFEGISFCQYLWGNKENLYSDSFKTSVSAASIGVGENGDSWFSRSVGTVYQTVRFHIPEDRCRYRYCKSY